MEHYQILTVGLLVTICNSVCVFIELLNTSSKINYMQTLQKKTTNAIKIRIILLDNTNNQ
jgi:hypothetical protein